MDRDAAIPYPYPYPYPRDPRPPRDPAEPVLVQPLETEPIIVGLIGKDTLQIWWTGDRANVEEIEFFLADKEQKILARQMKIAPPYEATFKRHKRMEFIGVTITHTDGTKRSILIPKRLLAPQAQQQPLSSCLKLSQPLRHHVLRDEVF